MAFIEASSAPVADRDSTLSRAAMLLPRLYLGAIFSVAAASKLAAPPGFAKVLAGYLSNVALVQGFPWYQSLVRAVILPHADLFAVLVVIGELFVGFSLLLGFLTRAGSSVAIVLLLNYLCSKGLPLYAPASNDAADVILALVVGLTGAGRVYGIDALIARRGRPF